jgi:hypothetical protein
MRKWIGWVVVAIALSSTAVLYLELRPRTHQDEFGLEQIAQLHSIDAAVNLFSDEFNEYPPSGAVDNANRPYCGAMKLSEAVVGRDLLGFHRLSQFRLNGTDPNTGALLYTAQTLADRKGPYLQTEDARAHRLVDIYGKGHTGPFPEDTYVLCDTFEKKRPSGKRTGMPILYYRANRAGTAHDISDPDNPANIYDYRDNQALIDLGVPGDPNGVHPLSSPRWFYLHIMSDSGPMPKPYRADSYILLSAGRDGLYGTADDALNCEWQYRGP